MLNLRKGLPRAVPVALGGDAIAMVRPATALEVARATATVSTQLAGLIAAEDAAALVAAALGEEFAGADFTDPEWVAAASQQLALVELAVFCVESWDGVAVDDTLVSPTREILALLLRDSVIAAKIRAAIEANVHEAQAEGEGSPVSPPGAGAAGESTAPDVDPPPHRVH